MNWIIRNTDKLKFHTNLEVLLKPIENDIKELSEKFKSYFDEALKLEGFK